MAGQDRKDGSSVEWVEWCGEGARGRSFGDRRSEEELVLGLEGGVSEESSAGVEMKGSGEKRRRGGERKKSLRICCGK